MDLGGGVKLLNLKNTRHQLDKTNYLVHTLINKLKQYWCEKMKTIFYAYNIIRNDAFYDSIWKNGTFVFDTNALLNMYRYQKTARNDLIHIMEKLSERIWIPYHVCLEYHRNKYDIISQHTSEIDNIKESIDTKVKSIDEQLNSLKKRIRIDSDITQKFQAEISKSMDDFFAQLDKLIQESKITHDNDIVIKEIYRLFEGKIGTRPSQETINEIEKDGENRFKSSVPPGFKDKKKDKQESPKYSHDGINYQGKYGDLFIWKQLIEHANTNELKDVIFITDDNKEDWWAETKGQKVAPRIELIDEIYRDAKVERFHMYSTENFIKYATKHLNIEINENTIEEVRTITQHPFITQRNVEKKLIRKLYKELENAADSIEPFYSYGLPDFITIISGNKVAYKIKYLNLSLTTNMQINVLLEQANIFHIDNDFSTLILIIICKNHDEAKFIKIAIIKIFEKHKSNNIPYELKCKIGLVYDNQDPNMEFDVIYEITSQELPDRNFFTNYNNL